jgi:hypothetical protein
VLVAGRASGRHASRSHLTVELRWFRPRCASHGVVAWPSPFRMPIMRPAACSAGHREQPRTGGPRQSLRQAARGRDDRGAAGNGSRRGERRLRRHCPRDPAARHGLTGDLRHSIGLGFAGKVCLHPREQRMTKSAFTPPRRDRDPGRRRRDDHGAGHVDHRRLRAPSPPGRRRGHPGGPDDHWS